MTVANGNGKVKIDRLELTNNNLVISTEEFQKGYNWNFTRYIEDHYNSGVDYLSWSNVTKALKTLFPTYHVEIESKECTYDREGHQNGVMLYARIRDLATNKVTPSMSFPVMNNKNAAIDYPNARDLSDSEQRAKAKAIAVYTGIGLRSWSREGIDMRLSDKKSNKDHPKFKALSRINELVDLAEMGGLLPDNFVEPHFGMSMFEINSIGKDLAELANNKPFSAPRPAYELWKKPQDCLEWAKEVLSLDDEAATALLKDTKADESGSKKISFYNRVMKLSK